MFLSFLNRRQRNHNIKTDTNSFENVAKFKFFGKTLTNEQCGKCRKYEKLNSGNACYNSVQNILSSRLLSQSKSIKIYRTIIWSVVSYGCENIFSQIKRRVQTECD